MTEQKLVIPVGLRSRGLVHVPIARITQLARVHSGRGRG